MNLNKFRFAYSRHGLIGFTNVLLGKIGFRFRLKTSLDKIVFQLGKNIEELSKNKILEGIYKGTYIKINKNWSNHDAASKYLGVYELEVQKEILKIQSTKKLKKKYIINLGAGEGFHIVGALKKKQFKYGVAYENDHLATELLKNNMAKNKLNNFKVFDKAKLNFLENDFFKKIKLSSCFFLIDIEGDEFKILNRNNLNKLKKSILIIEIHDFYDSPITLIKNLKKIFKTQILTTENRDLSKFRYLDHVHDTEKWLLVNEGRPKRMEWIVCTPK